MLKKKLSYNIVETFKLAVPVSIGQLGHIMLGVVDSMMVGKIGADSLAAASLANGLFFLVMVLGIGMSHAITALVAIAKGENQNKKCGLILRQALYVNIVFGFILSIIVYFFAPFIHYFGQIENVASLTTSYLQILSYSILPFMIFQTYRQYVEGFSFTRPPMYVAIVANFVNVFGNWVFIFGNFGLPALGLDGAGYSTLITRIFMAIFMMLIAVKSSSFFEYKITPRSNKVDLGIIKNIIKIGLPSGIMYSVEVGAFTVAAVIIGWLGSVSLAAHQIALNLASVSYMIVLGISSASTIRVGNAFGSKNYENIKLASFAALILSITFMGLSGLNFILFKDFLPKLYITDPIVVDIASKLLIIAALFQLSDGIQAVTAGILKGITDVQIPMIITILAYWIIAIPFGYFLGFTLKLEIIGIWIGLLAGLTLAAVFFLFRFNNKLNKFKREFS